MLLKKTMSRDNTCHSLVPVTDKDYQELSELKNDTILECKVRNKRNLLFHRKYFALLNLAFDHFEPPTDYKYKGQPVKKSFDRFRKDIAILAGFYDIVVNIKNELRYEAKSIAFGNMSEDEFKELYSNTIDVILQKVMKESTYKDIDDAVNQVIGFV